MCGRYQAWIDDDDVVRVLEREKKGMKDQWFAGQEVFPGTEMPLLYGAYSGVRAHLSRWGFELPEKDRPAQILINARAETAEDKSLFRESVKYGRSVVMASGYWEWTAAPPDPDQPHSQQTKRKRKCFFAPKADSPLLLMAALETVCEQEEPGYTRRYVILTTQAQGVPAAVHDRMPLFLRKDELKSWLYDEEFARYRMKTRRSWELTMRAE